MGLSIIFITYVLVWTLSVKYIPFLLEDAAVLAAFVYPNHIACLCSGGINSFAAYLQLQVVWV
ncbi:hypothetical protein EYW48_05860 [Vibrio sp. 1180_3]|nr:hypothetical protein [Vibrio sp. 1180_3]